MVFPRFTRAPHQIRFAKGIKAFDFPNHLVLEVNQPVACPSDERPGECHQPGARCDIKCHRTGIVFTDGVVDELGDMFVKRLQHRDRFGIDVLQLEFAVDQPATIEALDFGFNRLGIAGHVAVVTRIKCEAMCGTQHLDPQPHQPVVATDRKSVV